MTTVLLADELFFIAVDDRTGRPRLSPKVFGLGLAGALVGELLRQRWVTVDGDRLRALSRQPPSDALTHTVLDQLTAEPAPHPVRTWLVFLSRGATEQVAARLRRTGHIRQEQVRRWWRPRTRYPPIDINTAYMPTARLATSLRERWQVDQADGFLLGLALATGLDRHLLFTSDAGARDYLIRVVDHLDPSLHALVWHVHAAVGDAVLTGRT